MMQPKQKNTETEKNDLKKSFNKPRLYVPHINEIKCHTHPFSGARLVLGHIKGPARDEHGTMDDPFVIAWIAPDRTYITAHILCANENTAKNIFTKLKNNPNGPGTNEQFMRDWQKERVYAWEEDNIDNTTQILNDDQMHRVIKRVSDDFNLVAPQLEIQVPQTATVIENSSSYYYYNDNKIAMAHRGLSHLLHELAHMVDWKINKNHWAAHGPSFVRTLICIAEKYQWHDQKKLADSAQKSGLSVAALNDLPELSKHMTHKKCIQKPNNDNNMSPKCA